MNDDPRELVSNARKIFVASPPPECQIEGDVTRKGAAKFWSVTEREIEVRRRHHALLTEAQGRQKLLWDVLHRLVEYVADQPHSIDEAEVNWARAALVESQSPRTGPAEVGHSGPSTESGEKSDSVPKVRGDEPRHAETAECSVKESGWCEEHGGYVA